MTRWLVPALAAAALVWVALLIAAPLLPVPAAAIAYAAGSLLCHQLAERSFHLQSFQLPVCARCFGLYAGGAVGAFALAAGGAADGGWRLVRGRRWTITGIAALPTLVTVGLEWGAGWPISNMTRAIAGAPLGAVVAYIVAGALATLHYEQCAPRRPIGLGQPPSAST